MFNYRKSPQSVRSNIIRRFNNLFTPLEWNTRLPPPPPPPPIPQGKWILPCPRYCVNHLTKIKVKKAATFWKFASLM